MLRDLGKVYIRQEGFKGVMGIKIGRTMSLYYQYMFTYVYDTFHHNTFFVLFSLVYLGVFEIGPHVA